MMKKGMGVDAMINKCFSSDPSYSGLDISRSFPMRYRGKKLPMPEILCCLLLGIVLVLPVGCAPSSDENLQESPLAETGPQSPQTPEAANPGLDPATAARLERVRQSLQQGLDVNKADAEGRTALMMAAFDGYTEVVELLVEHGAEVDLCDGAGRTALMYAASGPFPQTVELLIKGGADVNLIDTVERWTALMFAAAEGHQPVVEVLLRHGADIDVTDADGDAAIDHARNRKQSHIVVLLESWPKDN